MKEVLMFYFPQCPYCREALKWIDEIKREDAKFASVEVRLIDEKKQPQLAEQYDYWNVPSFYVDGKKIHEGVATKAIVEQVLTLAL